NWYVPRTPVPPARCHRAVAPATVSADPPKFPRGIRSPHSPLLIRNVRACSATVAATPACCAEAAGYGAARRGCGSRHVSGRVQTGNHQIHEEQVEHQHTEAEHDDHHRTLAAPNGRRL